MGNKVADESIEQECPECGALCLVDDGMYRAIESLPVRIHENKEHLKGHPSLADMISTHIHIWREALAHMLLTKEYDSTYVEHEQKALDDIEKACAKELE